MERDPLKLEDGERERRASRPSLDAILSIPVTVQVVLGETSMPVAKLMKLGRGAVITLDQKVGAPVSVLCNGRVVARGEVVVVDEDNSRYGVSLTEIVGAPDRIERDARRPSGERADSPPTRWPGRRRRRRCCWPWTRPPRRRCCGISRPTNCAR